jgi:hypothetical protein
MFQDAVIHPDYDNWQLYFDVALLVVKPVTFSIFVRPGKTPPGVKFAPRGERGPQGECSPPGVNALYYLEE